MWFLLSYTFIVVFCALLLWIVWKMYQIRTSPLMAFPYVPDRHYVFGQFLYIMKEPPCKPQLEWAKKFGGLCTYRTAGTLKILVTDSEALKRILVTNVRNYVKSSETQVLLKPLLRNGVLTSEGKEHGRQRKYLNPAFHAANFNKFGRIFSKQAQVFCNVLDENIKKTSQGRAEINVNHSMAKLTLDIIGIAAFSYNFEATTKNGDVMYKAYTTVFENSGLSLWTLLRFVPLLRDIPTHGKRNVDKALETIRETVTNIVASKRAADKKGDDEDLLDLVLNQVEQDKSVTEDEIVDQVMTFLAAGHETTAVTLSWALYVLSKHPEKQERLHKELQSISSDKPIELSDVSALPYLDAVLTETMRLYPAAAITSRVSVEEDVLGGIKVPKGTPVFIPPMVIHRLPSLWERPDEFYPERFLEGGSGVETRRNPYAFIPFLAGERMCIGRRFALTEATMILAVLIRKYRFEFIPEKEVKPRLTITLRPSPDLHLNVYPRNQ